MEKCNLLLGDIGRDWEKPAQLGRFRRKKRKIND